MGEIRFAGTGETRGYPYLVCKKSISLKQMSQHIITHILIKVNNDNLLLLHLPAHRHSPDYIFGSCGITEFILKYFENRVVLTPVFHVSLLVCCFQEGQLSVTGESMCTKYWLTA